MSATKYKSARGRTDSRRENEIERERGLKGEGNEEWVIRGVYTITLTADIRRSMFL